MSHITYTWTAHHEQKIFGQGWVPDQPRAVFCLVHGHGEHSGRYAHVGQFLNDYGIALLGYDMFGHGRSEGKRGYLSAYEAALDTVDLLLREARDRFPDIPCYLYGHSAGGNFALSYALSRKPEPPLQGMLITSPWLELAFSPTAFQLFLARTAASIYPGLTQPSKLDATAISQDPVEVKKYKQDPLVHDKISPGYFLGCRDRGQWLLKHAADLHLPTLLMHGDADRITSFDASQRFAQEAGNNLMFQAWPGAYHELHHEPNRQEILQVMVDWLGGTMWAKT